MILASGRGKRFAPLTDHLPKPLLPAANWPLLDYLLTTVSLVGFSPIYVTVGYAGDHLQQFLEQVARQHRVVPIVAPNWAQGPLASFQAVLPHLNPDTPCVLLPGDLYLTPQILHLITPTATEPVLLYDSSTKRPGTLLRVDANHSISELIQSPVHLPAFHSALPILRASVRFFIDALALHPSSPTTVFDLLQRWLAEGYPIRGVPVQAEGWYDVDTPASLVALNHHLLTTAWPPTPRPPGTYLPPSTSMTGPVQSASLTLGRDSVVEGPVLLGPGVYIDEGCEVKDSTSLGASTRVNANASLTRCITLAHTHVPTNVELQAAILDARGNVVY
ncbi:MAG: NTP transferase domain-containing protein [Candidatus Hodarchaeota archaeon]